MSPDTLTVQRWICESCGMIYDPTERHEVRAISDARLLLLLAPWPGEGHPSQRA